MCPVGFLPLHRTRDVRTTADYAQSVVAAGRELRSIWRAERIDVVHAFSLISGLYAVAAGLGGTRPLLVHVQDAQPPRKLQAAALRIVGRRGTRLICVSHAVEQMLRDVGVPKEKLAIVYNGIESRFFDIGSADGVAVDGAGPHIGLFSHVIPWKGQDVFLAAAALVARRFPSARFYLVGATAAGVRSSYVESLHALAEAPPLAGLVRFVGPCRDVVPWMNQMDVVVHASVAAEAFGLVIAEGMALGKSVVASDCGAPRELVVDGDTGYLAHAGDAHDLARVLERVLEQRDHEVERRAAAAALVRFHPAVFGEELERLYEDVLRRPASPGSA